MHLLDNDSSQVPLRRSEVTERASVAQNILANSKVAPPSMDHLDELG